MSPIQLINPLDLPNWDELISSHPTANPFHSSGWARVLRDTYGFTPYYACVFKGDTLSACLPLMEVDSFLTGKRGVSLPFSDFCDPLLNGTVSSRQLTDFAIALGRDRHWKYLELRGGDYAIIQGNSTNSRTSPGLVKGKMEATARHSMEREDGSNSLASPQGDGRWEMEDGRKGTDNPNIPIFQYSILPQSGSSNIPPFHHSQDSLDMEPDALRPALSAQRSATPALRSYSHHILDLSPGVETLFRNLRESTRRNIRKAEKEGVTVRFSSDLEAVQAYFRLHCLTRKRHGVPPQPWVFFVNIHKHLISGDKGFVSLAETQGKEIAGAVYLTFGKSALYKFGASDLSFQHLRANNSAMWAAIRRLDGSGFRTLSFGRTEPENQGLIQFKSGWGAVEESLSYYRYDFDARDFISGNGKGPSGYEKVFQKLPEPALRLMGKVLYRHFGS